MLQSNKIVLQGQDIIRSFPKNISEKDIAYFESTIHGYAKETTIKVFKNVSINNELFIKDMDASKFHILMESFGDKWQDKKYNNRIYQTKNFVKNSLRKRRRLKEVLWCFDQFSTGGFYHWITEICPRLWIANEHVESSIPLLVPQYFIDRWSFAHSFLKPFKREIITFKESEVLYVDSLTFIGQTGGFLNFQPLSIRSSTQCLKDFYSKTNTIHDENNLKIYISRNKSGRRTIINENEILPLLDQHGFKMVYTEDLSLEEQIQMFSRATHLLSIHGAGLSNLVFMPPKSKVIEIRHEEPHHVLNCFYTLAHTFDMEYYYVFGKNKGDTLANEFRQIDKSIHVNVEMLRTTLMHF